MADSKYKAGNYISDRNISVFKSLASQSRVDSQGRIEKTYGTWSTEEGNLIEFKKGEKIYLSVDDMEVAGIMQLIDRGILVRTL